MVGRSVRSVGRSEVVRTHVGIPDGPSERGRPASTRWSAGRSVLGRKLGTLEIGYAGKLSAVQSAQRRHRALRGVFPLSSFLSSFLPFFLPLVTALPLLRPSPPIGPPAFPTPHAPPPRNAARRPCGTRPRHAPNMEYYVLVRPPSLVGPGVADPARRRCSALRRGGGEGRGGGLRAGGGWMGGGMGGWGGGWTGWL